MTVGVKYRGGGSKVHFRGSFVYKAGAPSAMPISCLVLWLKPQKIPWLRKSVSFVNKNNDFFGHLKSSCNGTCPIVNCSD